jgi:hypothetical protein
LGDVYNTQVGNLTNGVGIGSGTVTTLGNLGQQNANSISQLLGQKGGAQAAGTMGVANSWANGINDLQKQLIAALSGGGGF